MPRLAVIPATEAPKKPTRQSQYAIELIDRVDSLAPDQVLRVTPDDGMNLRGMRAGIGRILKKAAIEVQHWDDGTHAYISKV